MWKRELRLFKTCKNFANIGKKSEKFYFIYFIFCYIAQPESEFVVYPLDWRMQSHSGKTESSTRIIPMPIFYLPLCVVTMCRTVGSRAQCLF